MGQGESAQTSNCEGILTNDSKPGESNDTIRTIGNGEEDILEDRLLVASVGQSFGVNLLTLMLASSQFDSASTLFELPRDVITSILLFFVPSSTQRYLLYKPITRSYYRICTEMPYFEDQPLHDYPTQFTASITEYEAIFSSGIDLVASAKCVLRFLVRVKRANICFDKFSEMKMSMSSLLRFLNVSQCSGNLFDQYLNFLFLRYRRGLSLHPPLEIQAIWFTHMLQSRRFPSYFVLYLSTSLC
jgi:hypothetical protein